MAAAAPKVKNRMSRRLNGLLSLPELIRSWPDWAREIELSSSTSVSVRKPPTKPEKAYFTPEVMLPEDVWELALFDSAVDDDPLPDELVLPAPPVPPDGLLLSAF